MGDIGTIYEERAPQQDTLDEATAADARAKLRRMASDVLAARFVLPSGHPAQELLATAWEALDAAVETLRA